MSSDTTTTNNNNNNNTSRQLFEKLHLNSSVIENVLKNKKICDNLEECIKEAKIDSMNDGVDANTNVGKLIYDVATRMNMNTSASKKNRPILLEYIVNRKIDMVPKLEEAIKYCSNTEDFDKSTFESLCGVGVHVTREDVEQATNAVIAKYKDQFATEGKALLSKVYTEIRQKVKWADGKDLKEICDPAFEAALKASGWDPSVAAKKPKSKKEKKTKENDTKKSEDEEEIVTMEKWLKGRDLKEAHNSPEKLAEREEGLKKLGLPPNTFLSRFPPEPNGFLHIGHCKAMTFNFDLAESHQGFCYLRFDDTNPAAEEQVYIDNIIENVKWMGFKPWSTTFSSDYFEQMYQLAIKMIKDGNAYVCHQTQEEMEASRKTFRTDDPKPSPWRDRPIEENLKLFEAMRHGYFDEGEACLRMKGDYYSDNPNMWDHVAYRIIYMPHPHVGDKWCIYPTYDYTHCIIDSLEWISASCCTLEFENRRESYFWLLDVLGLYKPVVWEYSRLNITYNVLSKRKLLKLVQGGYVRGWDDPRMLTINGLRRRGYTAQILRYFCEKVGVTRKNNFISPKLLEACAREKLNEECPRGFGIAKPLKITLTNFPKGKPEMIECPDFPQKKENSSKHTVPLDNVVYIDEDDFKENPDNKFYGLAPGRTVRLKYAYNITCTKVIKDSNGKVVELECEYDASSRHDLKNIKQGHLSWVSNGIKAEFRLYSHLFKAEFPEAENWLELLDPKSEITTHGYVDRFVMESKHERFQFERVGFFVRDNVDFKEESPVFNRIVPLKESAEKRHLN